MPKEKQQILALRVDTLDEVWLENSLRTQKLPHQARSHEDTLLELCFQSIKEHHLRDLHMGQLLAWYLSDSAEKLKRKETFSDIVPISILSVQIWKHFDLSLMYYWIKPQGQKRFCQYVL